MKKPACPKPKRLVREKSSNCMKETSNTMTKQFKATINPVDFTLDKSELEILARHYFNVRLDYEWDRHFHPGWAISSSEWWEYMFAEQRLSAIETVLGNDEMVKLMKSVTAACARKVGEKNWTAFTTGVPALDRGRPDDEGCDICDPDGMEALRKAGGVITEEEL